MSKQYYIYTLMNQRNTVLYTGVTNNLIGRTWLHKQKLVKGFTKKYNVEKSVYYEVYNNPQAAIEREKQIKGWTRQKKEKLIKKDNPEFRDLYEDLLLE